MHECTSARVILSDPDIKPHKISFQKEMYVPIICHREKMDG